MAEDGAKGPVSVVDFCWDEGFEEEDIAGDGDCVKIWSETTESVV